MRYHRSHPASDQSHNWVKETDIESDDLKIVLSFEDPVFVADTDESLVVTNAAFKKVFGNVSDSSEVGTVWPQIRDVLESAGQIVGSGSQIRMDVEATDAEGRELVFDVRLVRFDNQGKIMAISRDVTADRARTRELEEQATTDQLTGAFNGTQLNVLLDLAIRSAIRQKTVGCFLYVDVDNFKPINDQHGHAVGDSVLRSVVQTLKNNLRESDIVGRLGGDEFGVVLLNANAEASTSKALQLSQELSKATQSVASVDLKVSIGIAEFPTDGQIAGEIIELADRGMYQSKLGQNSIVHITRSSE